MATSKCYYPRQSHRFFSSEQHVNSASDFELDEWDIYNSATSGSDSTSAFAFSDLTFSSGANRKRDGRSVSKKVTEKAPIVPSSLPVNVPDWSKILGEERRGKQILYDDVEGDEIGCGGEARRIPPHELMARRRMASFSVHEGVGRTLKGRDLSRVRNAIFEITGFQD